MWVVAAYWRTAEVGSLGLIVGSHLALSLHLPIACHYDLRQYYK